MYICYTLICIAAYSNLSKVFPKDFFVIKNVNRFSLSDSIFKILYPSLVLIGSRKYFNYTKMPGLPFKKKKQEQ